MRFGYLVEGTTLAEISANVDLARQQGYTSAWMTDGVGFDPLTILALVGQAVPDIELGTAVVRTLPRHPMALAQQALTVNATVDRRLLLGIGPSHRPSIEAQWGLPFDRILVHMRDYLSVLLPLVRDGSVAHDGTVHSAHASLFIDDGRPMPVLLGALGEQMLRLAGARADGTITFMTGPRTLLEFTCPTIREAADRAGRPAPRIVVMLPVIVTDDLETARSRAAAGVERMAGLPSYAAALEREGEPPLVAGSEDQVRAQLAALETAGVTDVIPTRVARRGSPDEARTKALLGVLSSGEPGRLGDSRR